MVPPLARIAADPIRGRAGVLLPLPIGRVYDYRIPEDLTVYPGSFVLAPLGAREVAGVVWGVAVGDVDDEKLKKINAVLDLPPLTEELRELIRWTASYTLSSPGSVLRMAMSVPAALTPPKPVTAYTCASTPAAGAESAATDSVSGAEDLLAAAGVRATDARKRVMSLLADGTPRRLADIARAADTGAAVVHGLEKAGLVQAVALSVDADIARPDPDRLGPVLSGPQAEAVDVLKQATTPDAGFSVTLLDGVTGSGKTEVYFEAIAETLKAGRQVAVLLPEIALTAQWLDRFEERFGARPVEWHSEVTGARRRNAWRAVIHNRAKVVVGARSALFLPYADLGLIVIDEEHDASFKQEDGVMYNARDMAVVRARTAAIPLVLASATPSLETVVNVRDGRYQRLVLPERHGGASLPSISAIDMRAEDMDRQSWISPTLREAIIDVLGRGEQAMLFLNRRGYAPLTLCRGCGHRMECPRCTSWLVEHRLLGELRCHHCGYAAVLPSECRECGAVDSFAACGPGVERLAEEVAAGFPDARTEIMSSDTVHGASAIQSLIDRVDAGDVDILIGTQIMAKGHHFPMLTLVGVIDADLGLKGGDLRASERTYQLLHQVAGRSGRAERAGRVLLQTYDPSHPVIRALESGERDSFLVAEIAEREAAAMPPFGRLAAVIVSGPAEADVDAAAAALARTAPAGDDIRVLGPAPAPLAIVRGRHRRRFLVKARRDTQLQSTLRRWLRQVRTRGKVRVQVDIDPYSFL